MKNILKIITKPFAFIKTFFEKESKGNTLSARKNQEYFERKKKRLDVDDFWG